MNLWFVSDPHWGHDWVSQLRGYKTSQDHDAWLLDTLQSTFKKNDTVWWLGDLAMANPTYALALTNTLPGTHHLVAGNHDQCHPMHRNAHSHTAQYLNVFKSVQAFARRKINGQDVLLSHFPYSEAANADHTHMPRYVQYRFPDLGTPLIHGHTHGQERLTSTVHNTQQVHVGLDAWKRPVNLDEIAEMLR